MTRKHFVLPWLEKHVIFCPKCNGTIETVPLVWGEETKDIALLETTYGLKIDAELLARLPKLSEADCQSRQKWLSYREEFKHPSGIAKTYEELKEFYTTKDGLVAGFSRHGIFVLLDVQSMTHLKILFLLLSLEKNILVQTSWLRKALGLSTASVSGILKKLKEWGLVKDCSWDGVKGRARGRQRYFFVCEKTREVLDRDLQNHAFFRKIVRDVVDPVAQRNPADRWRKDLFEIN